MIPPEELESMKERADLLSNAREDMARLIKEVERLREALKWFEAAHELLGIGEKKCPASKS